MAVWGGLTNSCENREAKSKGEKERYIHLNAEFQRIARKDKKAFLSNLEISSRKLEIPREHLMQRCAGLDKGQK